MDRNKPEDSPKYRGEVSKKKWKTKREENKIKARVIKRYRQ